MDSNIDARDGGNRYMYNRIRRLTNNMDDDKKGGYAQPWLSKWLTRASHPTCETGLLSRLQAPPRYPN